MDNYNLRRGQSTARMSVGYYKGIFLFFYDSRRTPCRDVLLDVQTSHIG